MTPGILVILVTMIGMILSALNLVREKELGTAEMINVTPIKKYQFITGKKVNRDSPTAGKYFTIILSLQY